MGAASIRKGLAQGACALWDAAPFVLDLDEQALASRMRLETYGTTGRRVLERSVQQVIFITADVSSCGSPSTANAGSVCARDIEAPSPQNIPTSPSALAVRPGLLTGGRAVQSGTARNPAVFL
jgi:hypothetical protein